MCCSMSLEIYVLQYDSLYAMGLSPMGLLWKVHICVYVHMHSYRTQILYLHFHEYQGLMLQHVCMLLWGGYD